MERRAAVQAALIATLAAAVPVSAMKLRNKKQGSPGKMTDTERFKCIDVHAHFIPEAYRTAAVAAGHGQPDGMPGFPGWNATAMLETMDRLAIQKAYLSISSPGVHFGDDKAAYDLAMSVNDEGAKLKATHPDRFGHFGSLPLPNVSGALAETARIFDVLGSDGVIIESNSGGIYPGDRIFEPVFEELNRRQAVVLLHPTSPDCPACIRPSVALPRPALEFMFETARAVTNLLLSGTLTRFPSIRFIIPHAGATLPVLVDRVAMVAGIIPDLTSVKPETIFAELSKLYFDLAGAPVPRLLPALRSFADPSRLLYGSDWPFTPEPAVAYLRKQLEIHLAAEPELLENILRNNALNLLER